MILGSFIANKFVYILGLYSMFYMVYFQHRKPCNFYLCSIYGIFLHAIQNKYNNSYSIQLITYFNVKTQHYTVLSSAIQVLHSYINKIWQLFHHMMLIQGYISGVTKIRGKSFCTENLHKNAYYKQSKFE